MTRLLRLYPRAWRRRYGDEVAAMLAGRPFSLALAIDLLGGAVDVWLHPAQTLAAANHHDMSTKENVMRILGPAITRADQRKAIAMFAITILLTGTWMVVHLRRGDSPVADALSIMPWIVGMLISTRYIYLNDRPAAVFFTVLTFVSAVLLFGAGLLATGL